MCVYVCICGVWASLWVLDYCDLVFSAVKRKSQAANVTNYGLPVMCKLIEISPLPGGPFSRLIAPSRHLACWCLSDYIFSSMLLFSSCLMRVRFSVVYWLWTCIVSLDGHKYLSMWSIAMQVVKVDRWGSGDTTSLDNAILVRHSKLPLEGSMEYVSTKKKDKAFLAPAKALLLS